MKKYILIIFTCLTIYSLKTSAQNLYIEGQQIKTKQNLQFLGEPVYIPTKCKIIAITGNKSSFSLRNENTNTAKYQFFYKNHKYSPEFNKITIEPGKYYLYPDLPPNINSVKIKITLKPIDNN